MEHDVDEQKYRHVLGRFPSGVVVVTAIHDGLAAGMTCQSFLSLSLQPPLVGFSPAKTSRSYPAIRSAGAFCINVLAEEHVWLCRQFARSGTDKWAGVAWTPSRAGNPIIHGSVAWIDCRLEQEHEVGDHYFVVGRVRELDGTDGAPLLYHRSAFVQLERPAAA